MYENLKQLRISQGMTQEEFGQLFGIKKTTYAGYEIGSSDPKSDFWIAVAERFRVSIDYLMGLSDSPRRTKYSDGRSQLDERYEALDAHGRRLVDIILAEESRRIAEAPEENVVDLGLIRHYLYSPAAGVDGLISGSDYEDIPRTPEMPKNADFCLTVSGDSMEPYIHDGQMIFVSESEPVHEFEVGVWFWQGGTYVKQYSRSGSGVHLLSANPARENANIFIPREAAPGLVCFGKVVGIKKLPAPDYR